MIPMSDNSPVSLVRDVEASVIPVGTKVTLQKGEQAHITQSLGGSYTVIVNGNLFRIEGKDADALGLDVGRKTEAGAAGPANAEEVEKEIWNQLRSCYDPEIPVNIVDLGLIYDCHIEPISTGGYRVDVKMTLTAPGCGMGPVLQQDVQNKLLGVEAVDDVSVELVWDPPWNQGMLTEAAKLQLGLMYADIEIGHDNRLPPPANPDRESGSRLPSVRFPNPGAKGQRLSADLL
jgi:probable FeS assembly SUF system protein SufT